MELNKGLSRGGYQSIVIVQTMEKISFRRISTILLHLHKFTGLDQYEYQTPEKLRHSWVMSACLAQPCRNPPGSVPQSFRPMKDL